MKPSTPRPDWPAAILVGQAPRPSDGRLVDVWYLPQGPAWRREFKQLRRKVARAGGRLAEPEVRT